MTLNQVIAKDTVKATLATVFMQAVSLLVSITVAALFGANLRTDAYFLALSVTVIFNAAFLGALKAVFIPVFISFKTRKEEGIQALLGSMYFSVFVITSFVVLIIAILTPIVVPKLAAGLDSEGKRLAVALTYELLPLIVLSSFVGLFQAIYNSYQKFVAPILTPIIRSVVFIVFVFVFKGNLGIHSVAFGNVMGELVQVVVLMIILKFSKIHIGLRFSIHPTLLKMARLSIPPILGNAITKINPLIDNILIAGLTLGAVTSLNYSNKLSEIPLLLIGSGGFLTVILSYWSRTKAEEGIEGVVKSFEKTVIVVSVVFAPLITAMFVLRTPLIRFLYERKEFTPEATQTTATFLSLLLIGIIPLIIGRTLTRMFFVLEDTFTPFCIGIVRSIMNLTFSLILRFFWGSRGVAFATSLTSIVLMFLMVELIQRKVKIINFKIIFVKYLKILLSMILSGWSIMFLYKQVFIFSELINSLVLRLFFSLALASIFGCIVFFSLLLIFKLEEVIVLKRYVFKNIKR